jgi:NADH-quinone oxidoreductase subunit M
MNFLTAIISVPFFAALLLALIPRNYRFLIRVLALAATFATAAMAINLFIQFKTGSTDYQFVQSFPWVPSLGIALKFGVDGINIGLIAMGALVAFAAACVSWEIKSHEKTFYILLLIMSGGIIAAFASLDLFFFYFFHELALVPTFIMIGVWGRGENKNYATFQITIYLTVGALIALAGLIALYLQMPVGERTFSIPAMTEYFKTTAISNGAQHVIFPLLMFGFGILVSLWPFHSWAPLGYGAAPSATAMLHAGVLKKFGLYGLIRIAIPMMPDGAKHWLSLLALLCLGNILYVGWVAMRQRDFNLLLGNSSVAHMGFAFLGITSLTLIGVTGTIVLMVAHGLLAALSFGLSGYLYNHAGTLDMRQFGGLLKRLPFIGTALIMVAFAGCGLPGFGNFVGELMVMFGAWKSTWGQAQGLNLHPFVVVAAWGGLVVGALYALRAVRQMLHGQLVEKWSGLYDAGPWRRLPFCLLLASLFAIGCWPRLLTDKIKPCAEIILALAGEKPPPPPPPTETQPGYRTRRNANAITNNVPTSRPATRTRTTAATLTRTSAPVALPIVAPAQTNSSK